jgi:hypothetical protein
LRLLGVLHGFLFGVPFFYLFVFGTYLDFKLF